MSTAREFEEIAIARPATLLRGSCARIGFENRTTVSLSKVCIDFASPILSNSPSRISICFGTRNGEITEMTSLCLDAVENSDRGIGVQLGLEH